MKILVTGGAGFIGSHTADRYREAGHEVVLLDNLSTGDQSNVGPGIRLVVGDVRDRDFVNELFEDEKFDAVNHHAAQLDVRISVADPVFDAEQNIIGSLVLLDAADRTDVERFIFASSGGTVYGEQQVFPADESHPTEPISPYGVAKLAVEKYCGYYRYSGKLKTAILRYTNIYGPRQSAAGEAGVVAIFCTKMLIGEGPTINGSGEQTRDYVYVGDVAEANLRALEYLDDHDHGVFNVATNTEVTVNELFGHLNRLAGGDFSELHGPAKPGEQFRSVCSYDHAAKELGWKPTVSIEEGLERTFSFFREKVVG